MCFLTLLLMSLVGSFLVPDGRTSVHTPVGEIVGFSTNLNIKGTQRVVRKFLGIPYAESPSGARRFKKPVPKAAFTSAFDASYYGHSCFQFEGLFPPEVNVTYSEDCLSLNIFAPETPSNGRFYPVMVWIHGGGFTYGSTNGFDCGSLSAAGEVIVVTVNYRLNVFGFLSTSDPDSGGNFGLWDEQLAIKWVHGNIRAFGGDPTKVTVFGESSGAAAVIYQTIYQGNRGLFQRAIAESGSVASPWAFTSSQIAQNRTLQFAMAAGCPQLDSMNIIKCLQSKSSTEIRNVMNIDATTFDVWTPVIDRQFILDNPLTTMTDHYPSKGVEDAFLGIDLIIGVNSKEGFNHHFDELSMPNFTISDIDNIFIPKELVRYVNGSVPDALKDVTILEYKDWENIENKDKQLDRFVDLVSDHRFIVGSALTALQHTNGSSKTKTFVYKLSTAPPFHAIPIYPTLDSPTVANHYDDIAFIFGPWFEDKINFPGVINATITEEQKNTGQAMITMWTNFAKTG